MKAFFLAFFASLLALPLYAQEKSLTQIFAENPTYVRGELLDGATDPRKLESVIDRILDGDLDFKQVKGRGVWEALGGSSGGGGIIGNGGGLLESFFFSTLAALPEYIDSCLSSSRCQLDDREKQVLKAVSSIARENMKERYSLIFVDANRGELLFRNSDPTRVAMTGFTPGLPVFINFNHIYGPGGELRLEREQTISILVHELGHQTGEKLHKWLDRLGTKVQNFVSESTLSIRNERDFKQRLEVWIQRTSEDPNKLIAKYSFGRSVIDISQAVKAKMVCPKGQEPFDFEISNLHLAGSPGRIDSPKIGFWIDLQCLDTSTQEVFDRFINAELGLFSAQKNQ